MKPVSMRFCDQLANRPARSAGASERKPEVGLSHIALSVRDVDASAAFYARYARMQEVHRRNPTGRRVVWLSDGSRPFVIVLIEAEQVEGRLEGIAHLGIGCESREEVDALCQRAESDGQLLLGPEDAGSPVGYWALLRDPDGHNLELSHGQEVAQAVARMEPARQRSQREDRRSGDGRAAGGSRSSKRHSLHT